MCVVPTHKKLRMKDCLNFQANLNYIASIKPGIITYQDPVSKKLINTMHAYRG